MPAAPDASPEPAVPAVPAVPESGPFDSVPAESLPPWVGTPQQFAWLEWIVRAIVVLNVVDTILTLVWVSTGHAIEGNPLLWDLPEHFPLTFVTVKTSLVSLGTLLLWRYRARPLSVVALFVAFLAYYFLLLYHLAAMNLRLVARVAEWLNS